MEQKEQKEDNMVTHGNSSKISESLSLSLFLVIYLFILNHVYFGSVLK